MVRGIAQQQRSRVWCENSPAVRNRASLDTGEGATTSVPRTPSTSGDGAGTAAAVAVSGCSAMASAPAGAGETAGLSSISARQLPRPQAK
jgi:hypothetical protein